MSEMPEIGGRTPIPIEVRQELVRLRPLQDAAILRRLAQGDELHADRVQSGEKRQDLLLRLQALRQEAAQ
jgi:hypothetical protein